MALAGIGHDAGTAVRHDQRPTRTRGAHLRRGHGHVRRRAPPARSTRSSTTPAHWPVRKPTSPPGSPGSGTAPAGSAGSATTRSAASSTPRCPAPASTPATSPSTRRAHRLSDQVPRRRRRPRGRVLPEELRRLPAGLGPGPGELHRRRPAPARHRHPAGPVGQHPGVRLPGGAGRQGPRRHGVVRHQSASRALAVHRRR